MVQSVDFSAEGYIPECWGIPQVKTLTDLFQLGRQKLKELLQYWVLVHNDARRKLDDFCNQFVGPKYWETWSGDARHGGGIQDFGGGRYVKPMRRSFRTNNLSPEQLQDYKNLSSKCFKIDTKVSNIRMLIDLTARRRS